MSQSSTRLERRYSGEIHVYVEDVHHFLGRQAHLSPTHTAPMKWWGQRGQQQLCKSHGQLQKRDIRRNGVDIISYIEVLLLFPLKDIERSCLKHPHEALQHSQTALYGAPCSLKSLDRSVNVKGRRSGVKKKCEFVFPVSAHKRPALTNCYSREILEHFIFTGHEH